MISERIPYQLQTCDWISGPTSTDKGHGLLFGFVIKWRE